MGNKGSRRPPSGDKNPPCQGYVLFRLGAVSAGYRHDVRWDKWALLDWAFFLPSNPSLLRWEQ